MKIAKTTFGALTLGALALGGCGGVADNPEMLEEFDKQCRSAFVEQGGPADMVDAFCECSVEKVKEQELGAMDMLDTEKMTKLGEDCAKEVIAANAGEATEAAE